MLTKAYNPYFGRYGGRGMIGLFPLILKDCIKKNHHHDIKIDSLYSSCHDIRVLLDDYCGQNTPR